MNLRGVRAVNAADEVREVRTGGTFSLPLPFALFRLV
jgi:hypothetical protein